MSEESIYRPTAYRQLSTYARPASLPCHHMRMNEHRRRIVNSESLYIHDIPQKACQRTRWDKHSLHCYNKHVASIGDRGRSDSSERFSANLPPCDRTPRPSVGALFSMCSYRLKSVGQPAKRFPFKPATDVQQDNPIFCSGSI
jgi:hypothetical protein